MIPDEPATAIPNANPSPISNSDQGRDLGRIIGLSDGVFGFALTLLATGIGIPSFARDVSDERLTQEILSLVPQILIYAATFYFIIIKWTVHRRIFEVVVAYDAKLVFLNSLFLLMIAFLPVPSKILIEYSGRVAPVVFFAGVQTVTTFSQEALWWYITHQPHLMRPHVDAAYIHESNFENIAFIAVLLLSIAIAIFISPGAAITSWLLITLINNVRAQRKHHSKR